MLELLLFLAGCLVMVFGAVGIIRFPDVYTRLHASTKCDTGGALSILLALTAYTGITLTSIKILTIAVLIFLFNPVVSHALARTAHRRGIKPDKITVVDMYARDYP
ncbi:MAG: monovalent cation/H(+) antiporter subunit G [Methanomicrobia archaeon]|nr:monovalent cation/H(+) antiporter subunit G [Methanomicrobia archaeon]MCK4432737.1 monovalent cation/H(+) antiporter subunit G [Methanomicrobia archaeon]MCK4636294.1 monovalent cation/H(+) antiporter subunit G [Methanomicrobia archaeon]